MHKPYQHTKFAEANKQTNERTNCQPTNKQTNKPATDDEGNARPGQAKPKQDYINIQIRININIIGMCNTNNETYSSSIWI